jgi:hypothetical protein
MTTTSILIHVDLSSTILWIVAAAVGALTTRSRASAVG